MTEPALTQAQIEWAVRLATRAPSVHNTQPWRFTTDLAGFDLFADTARSLPATDPFGRELMLSCGAALYHLRLAVRGLGFDDVVTVLPVESDPRHVAHVSLGTRTPTAAGDLRAIAAAGRRHTHRGAFSDKPLEPGLAVLLQRAAAREGALLTFIHQPGQRRRIIELTNLAALEGPDDLEVRRELQDWTRPAGSTSRDGVPESAFPPDEALSSHAPAPRGFGRRGRPGPFTTCDPDQHLELAALTTSGDDALDWVAAGQALARVLVLAAEHWAFASLHSQITEVPGRREDLSRELGGAGHPHMLLGFGYASTSRATPRRPVSEVVDVTDPALLDRSN